MIERKARPSIAMSSLASVPRLPLMAGYCASKSGVNALFESLRLELAPFGIDTTIVCPGWIKTPLTANIWRAQAEHARSEVAVRVIVDTFATANSITRSPHSSAASPAAALAAQWDK